MAHHQEKDIEKTVGAGEPVITPAQAYDDEDKNGDLPYDARTERVMGANGQMFLKADLDGMQRRLKQRHVQMIAIAGTIGTGLFLGSGHALAKAGPLGALLAYAFIGTIAYSSIAAVGEMTCFAPISGTFPHYAARFVDPALGFAVGWKLSVPVPIEVTAAQILLGFWDKTTPAWAHLLWVLALMVAINLFGVRWFGESEIFFSTIKLMLITGLIIGGLVVSLGGGPSHERTGFGFWKNPGAMNTYLVDGATGRFLAVIGVLVQAAFSFQGMETVAIAAAETANPRRNIAKAVRRVFYRILVFYILGITVTGMLVPYNDPDLLQDTGDSATSPYVIAFTRAGVKGLPSVINAAVLTSAFSAENSFLYSASRILYGLALRSQAPAIFIKTTKGGLPINAVIFTSLFSLLAFMSVSSGSATAFNWMVNLTTIGGFFTWCAINLAYLGFYRAAKAQNYDRTQLTFFSKLQPWLSIWGAFWTALLIIINGFDVFFDFNATDFLVCYLNIPIFALLYFGFKIFKKTKIVRPHEVDLVTGIPSMEETESPETPPKNTFHKVLRWLF